MPIDPKTTRNHIDRRLVEYDDKMRSLDLWSMNLVPPEVGIFDEPSRCYKLNNEWARIIMGLVSWLAATPVWRDAENEGYFAIEQILKFMIGEDCMSFELRQNPDDTCLLEQSLDGGATWLTAFDYSLCSPATNPNQILEDGNALLQDLKLVYDGTVPSVAPNMVYDQTSEDDIRNLALCQALHELVDMMCEAELEYRQEVAAGATLAAIVLAVIAVVVLVATGGTTTPFYIALSAAFSGGFGVLFGGLSEAILNDHDARSLVACCMYSALKDATIDQTPFEQSLDDCSFAPLSNEEQLRGAIAQMLTQDDIYISFLDYLQREFGLADLGLAECPCDTTIQVCYDMTELTELTLEFGNVNELGGNPSPAVEWDEVPPAGSPYVFEVLVRREFVAPITILEISGQVYAGASGGNESNGFTGLALKLYDSLDQLIAVYNLTGQYTFQQWNNFSESMADVGVSAVEIRGFRSANVTIFGSIQLDNICITYQE